VFYNYFSIGTVGFYVRSMLLPKMGFLKHVRGFFS